MDYFMLNNNAPAPSWGEWLLASEYERASGSNAKSDARVMMLGEQRIAINIGCMYAKRSCKLLRAARDQVRELSLGRKRTWSDTTSTERRDKGYLEHQLLIQEKFARTNQAERSCPLSALHHFHDG
jgi:hypothetical protein